jgi:hypothetical protein
MVNRVVSNVWQELPLFSIPEVSSRTFGFGLSANTATRYVVETLAVSGKRQNHVRSFSWP